MSHDAPRADRRPVRRPIEPYWGRGVIESVNIGRERHSPKEPVSELTFVPGHGIVGDVHAGEYRLHAVREPIRPNTREVSLIDAGVLDALIEMGYDVSPGALGENLTVRGMRLDEMAPGDRLYCGSLVLEVTENRTPCTVLPAVDSRMLRYLFGRAGLLAYVVRGGVVRAGMEICGERAEMPETQRSELASRVVDASLSAFGERLRGAILKGSAFKGGFIPGYSDFDLHLLVDGEAMEDARSPKAEFALRLQRALGRIDREPYRVNDIQVCAIQYGRYPQGWMPPLPGTFTCIYGTYPGEWDSPDPKYVRSRADAFLERLPAMRVHHARSFQDAHDRELARPVRLLGVDVKPALYCGAIRAGYDPLDVWTVRPLELVQWARRKGLAMEASWRFLTGVGDWEAITSDPERLRALWLDGMDALGDVESWVTALAGVET